MKHLTTFAVLIILMLLMTHCRYIRNGESFDANAFKISADLQDKNLFTNREYQATIQCINHSDKELTDTSISVDIQAENGTRVFTETIESDNIKAVGKRIIYCRYELPKTLDTGHYKMKVSLCSGKTMVTTSEYKLFVLSWKDEHLKIKTNKKVAVIGHSSRLVYGFSVCRVLTRLGINYDYFHKAKGYTPDKYDLVIIDKDGGQWGGNRLKKFLNSGGQILCFEPKSGIRFLHKKNKMTDEATLATNIKIEKGTVVLSQIDALDNYGFDSVATKHLHDMLKNTLE